MSVPNIKFVVKDVDENKYIHFIEYYGDGRDYKFRFQYCEYYYGATHFITENDAISKLTKWTDSNATMAGGLGYLKGGTFIIEKVITFREENNT